MLIKPGAMPLYNEIVNTWDPKDLKFTFEWIGRMELEIENGNMVAGRIQKKFDTLAKGHELKLVYEMQSIKSKDA